MLGHTASIFLFAIVPLLFSSGRFAESQELTTPEPLALVGGTVYVSPFEDAFPNAVVLVEGGRIVSVGARGAVEIPDRFRILDCSGMTVTAGFWNSHVHFFERKWEDAGNIPAGELDAQLQDMVTRYGFTSVFDTGSLWENTRSIRDRIESGEVPGPRIRSTGPAMVPPGALPPDIVLDLMGSMHFSGPEIESASQSAAASRQLLDEGVDGIKLFASLPGNEPLPQAVLEAAVREAHRSGKPVFLHPNSAEDILVAVGAGVDVIAHTTPQSGSRDDAVLRAMREADVALVPTLWLWKYYARHDRKSAQDLVVDAEVRQLRAWIAAGGRVLFGTDLGAVDPDPVEEYILMAQAGLGFREILASLTTSPTEEFGEAQRLGRVAAGFAADLVVLEGDPSEDLRALATVRYTLRAGEIIYGSSE